MLSHLLFADVSGEAVKSFGEALAWLLGLVLVVAAVVKLFRGREATKLEQPVKIAKHHEYATLERLEQLEKAIETLRDQRRLDVASLHRKIEDVLQTLNAGFAGEFKEVRAADARHQSDIASLKAETNHIVRQVQVLDAKIDGLPERIFRMGRRSA